MANILLAYCTGNAEVIALTGPIMANFRCLAANGVVYKG